MSPPKRLTRLLSLPNALVTIQCRSNQRMCFSKLNTNHCSLRHGNGHHSNHTPRSYAYQLLIENEIHGLVSIEFILGAYECGLGDNCNEVEENGGE